MFHTLLSILSSNGRNYAFISIVSGTLLLVQLLNLAHLLKLCRIQSNSLGCRCLAEASSRNSLGTLSLFSALVSPCSFNHCLIILSSEARFRVTASQRLAITVHPNKVAASHTCHLSLLALCAIGVRISVGLKCRHVGLEFLVFLRILSETASSTSKNLTSRGS